MPTGVPRRVSPVQCSVRGLGARWRVRWVAAIVLLGALVAGAGIGATPFAGRPPRAAAAAAPSGGSPAASRVLIISLPHVSWLDLAAAHVPNLDRLMRGAAVGDLTTRTINSADLAAAYTTVGAGTRATGSRLISDGAAFEVDEPFGNSTAGEVFETRTGHRAGSGLVHLGVGPIEAANAREHVRVAVGRLGDALARAGYERAVIGNADGAGSAAATTPARRQLVAALMGHDGRVPEGAVGPELLVDDPAVPYGLRLDPDAVMSAFQRVWTPKSVVLVEGSDLARARELATYADSRAARALITGALERTDALVGRLLSEVDPARDAVVVLGPTPSLTGGTMTVAAVRAPGWSPGLLRSASTRRTGYVLLADVGPTVLKLVGRTRPQGMNGRPFTVQARGTAASRRAKLVRAISISGFRDSIRGPFTRAFLIAQAFLAALASVLLVASRRRRGIAWQRARIGAEVLAWGLLAVFPLVYVARLVPFDEHASALYYAFLAVAAAIGAMVYRTIARRSTIEALIAATGAIVAVLVLDILTGARLQLGSSFGYSARVGIRISGFGNVSYAALTAAAILLAGLLVTRVGGRIGIRVALGVLALVFVADTAPMLGSDIGGVLSIVPAFGVAAALLLGVRIRRPVRAAVIAVFGVACALAGLIAVDLLRPANQRTHLGRLVTNIHRNGWSELTDTIIRKAQANLDTLSQSEWRGGLVVALLAVIYLVRAGWVKWAVTDRFPALRASLVGFVVLAGLGYALNDSGVAVPAVMLSVLVPVLVLLILGDERPAPPRRGPRAPDPDVGTAPSTGVDDLGEDPLGLGGGPVPTVLGRADDVITAGVA